MLQVDTFEAVKTNVYSVLGDLAKDLHGPELDLLFSKFEACTGWPAPDTLKAMDLLKQLAKSDAKVGLHFSLLVVLAHCRMLEVRILLILGFLFAFHSPTRIQYVTVTVPAECLC